MTSNEIHGKCQIEVQTQRSNRAKSFQLHNLRMFNTAVICN